MGTTHVPTRQEQDALRDEFHAANAVAEQEAYRAELLAERAEKDRLARLGMPATLAEVEASMEDAKQRLPKLEALRQTLAPEALLDNPKALDELEDVESQIRSCRRAIDLYPVAAEEFKRRELEAKKLEKARAPHLAEARRLQAERETLATAAHKAMVGAFGLLRDWDAVTTSQEVALRRAGRDGAAARPKRWMVEAAVQAAIVEAQLPVNMIRLESQIGQSAPARPLPQVDLHPIDAEAEKE